ncbi:MAG: PqqD family protein [Rectinema sp.]
MLRLKDSVMKTMVDNEIVLLDKATGMYYGLNETASRMLELALEQRKRDEIFLIIQEEFDVDMPTIESDFDALVENLINKGLALESEE